MGCPVLGAEPTSDHHSKLVSTGDEFSVENPHDEIVLPRASYEGRLALPTFLNEPALAVAGDCMRVARQPPPRRQLLTRPS